MFGKEIFSLSKISNAIMLRSRILKSTMDTDIESSFPLFFYSNLEPNPLFLILFFLLPDSIYENHWQSIVLF